MLGGSVRSPPLSVYGFSGRCRIETTKVGVETENDHRFEPGSIGGASTPSRVFKGIKMAGRMGVDRQTTQNLTVHAVDAERGFLLVKGAVPGPKGGVVVVRSAVKGA